MTVIPVINETNFEGVKKKIELVKGFSADWIHIDVADGKFTRNLLWNNPSDLANFKLEALNLKSEFEVHLMIENPDEVVADWLKTGVKRLIVHVESIKDAEKIKKQCKDARAELFFAFNPETPVDDLSGYKDLAEGFLVLAVVPGTSGQEFQEEQLDKVAVLRQKFPDVRIEVDGGVNLKTALRIKAAGADILVSASYIWGSLNPQEAYEKLSSI